MCVPVRVYRSRHRRRPAQLDSVGTARPVAPAWPADPADTLPILKCTGVVNIVSFEGRPAVIPDVELDSIRLLVGSELQYDPCPMIHEGMMVEVTHGPLKGVVGRLVRKDTPKARLVLSVNLIGQAVSVEVDASDVKPY